MPKRKLITSALPYVNNAPHLGNIIGCVLSADVFARFCRSRGYETLYVCGTDGYGTATETKAKKEGTTPEAICQRFHQIHESVYRYFNIQFDAFGKTFAPQHTQTVQHMYHALKAADAFVEKEKDAPFCNDCDKFLADRFVEGVCPHCGYEHARGDQCESCGKLLNPEDLKQPSCAICTTPPEMKSTKHLYLDLEKLSPKLEKWLESTMGKHGWTLNARTTTQSWLNQGLQPRPITRDLKWGVAVPEAGYEHKVFYVWFDAPLGYISITQSACPDSWQKWWLEPENTELHQFLGKDNIPFHSVMFPSCLMNAQQDWVLPHRLNVTEYLNYENTKFSKSKNVGVFGTDVAELGFPVDFWRFYLLSVRPEKQDANFLWEDFFDKVNNELVDNIGNLVNRVMTFHGTRFSGPLKNVASALTEAQQEFVAHCVDATEKIAVLFEAGELKDALKQTMLLGKAGNKFFHDQQPWQVVKSAPEQACVTTTLILHLLRDLGVLLAPYIPESAQKILAMVGAPAACWSDIGNFSNLAGVSIGSAEILFEKLDVALVERLKAKFSGQSSGMELLDIRVGEILSVQDHPQAAHLYVQQIDVGQARPISVASALKKHFSADELVGKKVLVLVNLAPADLRGVTSEGMVLVAEKRKKLELFEGAAWQVGMACAREGYPSPQTPPAQISFETFSQQPFQVQEGKLMYGVDPVHVDGTPVTTHALQSAKVK
ncbi:MAG: methionine--tRNA ligase [Zetaproteobacteria bacterium]|nr:methionine--tRNA ligase [Zetaproteobacteria bacterium]